jgi:hypothetical protein
MELTIRTVRKCLLEATSKARRMEKLERGNRVGRRYLYILISSLVNGRAWRQNGVLEASLHIVWEVCTYFVHTQRWRSGIGKHGCIIR